MKSTASSTRFDPFGTTTRSLPMKEAVVASFHAGEEPDSKMHLRILVAGERDIEVARAHHADLAGTELQVEGLAVLGAVAFVNVAGLDHITLELESLDRLCLNVYAQVPRAGLDSKVDSNS